MRVHEFKTDPLPFQAVASRLKTHEIRDNRDRGVEVGDVLVLRETLHTGAEMREGAPLVYTDRVEIRDVTHVQTGYGLQTGWVILSFGSPEVARHRWLLNRWSK